MDIAAVSELIEAKEARIMSISHTDQSSFMNSWRSPTFVKDTGHAHIWVRGDEFGYRLHMVVNADVHVTTGYPPVQKAKANKTHFAIAALHYLGYLQPGIITQNVDR